MRIVNVFFPAAPDARVSAGLLILRAIAGIALMIHGWGKIQQPFGWMPPDSPIPGWMQAFAAVGEFGGGLCLLLGFVTPLAAVGIASTMIGAILIAHRNDPWINPGGSSWELASLYLLIAVVVLAAGPGRYALDTLLFGARRTDPERLNRV